MDVFQLASWRLYGPKFDWALLNGKHLVIVSLTNQVTKRPEIDIQQGR